MMIIRNRNNYRRNALNEAVQRTIDQKLWASVSSGISRNYKNDLGASAKPIGTRDQLLQRYIAALVILKQQCPMSLDELKNSKAFPQWGAKLAEMGVTIEEVQKLWNENCGKLPQVEIGAGASTAATHAPATNNMAAAPADVDDDNDDLGFALGMTDDEYQADRTAKRVAAEAARQAVQTSAASATSMITDDMDDEEGAVEDEEPVKYRKADADDQGFRKLPTNGGVNARIVSGDDIDNPGMSKPNLKSNVASLGKVNTNPEQLKRQLHKGLITGRKFPELFGCQNPNDSIKVITARQLPAEGIQDCENLDDFKSLMSNIGVCFAMRVFAGGDPEDVKGDVVWADAPTETSYYIAVGNDRIGIYYKDSEGIFTCAYSDTLSGFGFSE